MKLFCLAGLALSCALFATQSQSQPQTQLPSPPDSAVRVKDFDVFVDPPTGFVFVKLPQGWKFVGKLEQSNLKSLPSTVLTSLLDERASDTSMAKASP